MAYDLYDFTESIAGVGIEREQIKRCTLGFGDQGDYAEWDGGFVIELKDGRWALVCGWCDTTGWGCQDGTFVDWFDSEPTHDQIEAAYNAHFNYGDGPNLSEADKNPTDVALHRSS